jgi:excisionase family DNA binding protein
MDFPPIRAYHNSTNLSVLKTGVQLNPSPRRAPVGIQAGMRRGEVFCTTEEFVERRWKMEQIYVRSSERLVLLTAREAASYLRVSLSTLHRMERRGLLSPLRTPGGHRRYTLEMLNDCLSFDDFDDDDI